MHITDHDVEHRNTSGQRQGAEPPFDWRCWISCFAKRILLRLAHWVVDNWSGRHLAHHARPVRCLSHGDFGDRRVGSGLGLVPAVEALELCQPQTLNSRHIGLHNRCLRPRRQLAPLGRRRGTNDVCSMETNTMKGWLLPVGLGGAGLAAVCCLTPFLPWLFSLLGISGTLGYIYRDDVLLPILAGFLILTGYALWRRRRTK
jgi:mercuric ion transport protein